MMAEYRIERVAGGRYAVWKRKAHWWSCWRQLGFGTCLDIFDNFREIQTAGSLAEAMARVELEKEIDSGNLVVWASKESMEKP